MLTAELKKNVIKDEVTIPQKSKDDLLNRADTHPHHVTLVTTDEQVLERAIIKWIRFQNNMWEYITIHLEQPIKNYNDWGIGFRLVIILLSATLTAIADLNEIPRTFVTVLAGVSTALTTIEAFFKFTERRVTMQQQQRELQAKRDELRYDWMTQVELEKDLEKRLKAAKSLLESGPKAYNDILNKYSFKSKDTNEAPQAT